MSEFADGFLAMPTWAQVGVGWFVLMVLVMLLSPGFQYRHHRARFERLARALGTEAARGRDPWPLSFTVQVDGRAFEVHYDHFASNRLDLRPSGHVLVSSTLLSGSAWTLHEVDIVPGAVPRWLRPKHPTPGAAAQDAPFQVRSAGSPVRQGWFDTECRAAVTAFYALGREVGPMQVRAQTLTHHTSAPWPARDGESLRELLRRQAAVAEALERSAGTSAACASMVPTSPPGPWPRC
jgi:hypothetical protein